MFGRISQYCSFRQLLLQKETTSKLSGLKKQPSICSWFWGLTSFGKAYLLNVVLAGLTHDLGPQLGILSKSSLIYEMNQICYIHYVKITSYKRRP